MDSEKQEEIKKVIEDIQAIHFDLDIDSELADTEEYKALFQKAKEHYPDEYDYLIHTACVSYFMDIKNK